MNVNKLVDQLNELLPRLKIPRHRAYVTSSGTNVSWLQKKLKGVTPTERQVLDLLSQMPMAKKKRGR